MKNKLFRACIVALAISSLTISSVYAAPDADAIKDKKNAAEVEVSSLQEQIADVVREIDDLEEQLITTGEEINQATEDLAAAEEKEKEQYEAMKLRIKYMYEEGNSTILEKITESGSITEFLNKAEYIQNVHNYDREQLQEYVNTKEEVAELKSTLETEQANLEAKQSEFEEKKQSLNDTLESKQDEVADLDAEYQAALEEIEKERQAAAEAEARRQQAAAAANQNKNNTTGNTTNGGTSNGSNSSSSGSNSSYVSPGNSSTASAIVNAAYSQLGTPYVWGGTSPNVGLDCSGLVQYCHRVAGISLPRTSGPQGSGGQAVSNPQPGDVVCYSGHVGIYIGGGQMIHAPQPGDVVKIQSVYGRPWYRRYW